MDRFAALTASLRGHLEEKASAKSRDWWESYVKESAPFLGVKMADTRTAVHRWHRAEVDPRLSPDEQVELALALLRQATTEEKLAGMLLLQEILLPAGAIRWQRELPRFAALFHEGFLYDWNVCDWFCVKVLGPLIAEEGMPCAEAIAVWREAENLWQARASLVAFVPVADQADYYPLLEQGCRTLIRRPERFAKTAVGWLLRELSQYDAALAQRVLTDEITHFSTEALKNATKYLDPETTSRYRALLKTQTVA